jgi:hypothetical protein
VVLFPKELQKGSSCSLSESPVDLASIFGVALKALKSNRQDVNQLDGYNGNHGDNMVENMRIITEALQAKRSEAPSDALQYASQVLQEQGRGGSSQYYAQGLNQAADQFQGQDQLNPKDIMPLLNAILGAVPSESAPQQSQTAGSVLESVMGLASQAQSQPKAGGADVASLLNTLLPAGMAFLQAKASGADNMSAAQQVMMKALMGGTVNPLQTGKPRSAAAGLVVQSILQALAGGM